MAELRVLGPVQMWVANKQVDLGPLKQRTVLAAVLVDAGRLVTTETLIDRVWGQEPPASARSGLYSYITRLRQTLRRAGGDAAALRLDYVPGGYRLEVERSRVDLHRFQRLVEQAKRPGIAEEQRCAVLDQAYRLWRGEALAGLEGEWAARTREVLAQQRLEVAVSWARSQLRLGRATETIGPLRELVILHPHVEPLVAMLIEALYRDGRSAEALELYSTARDRLVAELGVEPGAELRRLHQTILRDGWEAGAPEPEQALSPPVPAQLPLDVHGFTCRKRELAELDSVLAAGHEQPTYVPIAALLGTAGVGKTTLAVHWAHRMAGRFRDGQLYVDLRGFAPSGSPMTPIEAMRGFLDALGVPPERRPADLAAQVGLYRSLVAGKQILVVLDNAATAEQVRPLLPGSPGCAALVTSRNQLSGLVRAEGARPLTVGLLNATQSRELLVARIGRKRVAAEPLPVDEIITRCAGLPLALAVVAARAAEHPSFSLADLAAQLRETPGELDAFGDNDPTADMRAVLSWSYRTVNDEAASLFRLLSLPPGPDISVAAAASLAGIPKHQSLALLTELARAHLVVEQRPGRYAFHDLLRAYASELAQQHHSEAGRRAALLRVLDHYLHTAAAAARLMSPHRDPISVEPAPDGVTPEQIADGEHARIWFADHHEILLDSVRVAAASGLDGRTWAIAWTLTSPLDLGFHWQDLADTQAAALEAAARLGDLPGQAYTHRILGRARARLGCHGEARSQYRKALAMCEQLGDHTGQAHTHLNLAWLFEQQGDYQAALEHARQAHDLYWVAGHRAGQGSALNQLGWYHTKLGSHEKALTHCEQALEMQRETGHRYGQASTWHSLGFAHHHLGHYEEAVACYGHAIDAHRETGDRYREAVTLVHLGDSRQAADDRAAAGAAWRQAMIILEQIGHPDAELVRGKLSESR